MNKELHFKSEKQTWETPLDFFSKLDQLFSFTLDACASSDNGEVVLMASPKRAFAGYALVFNGQLPMGCVWSTTRVGVKCVALASWNEIKEMELKA